MDFTAWMLAYGYMDLANVLAVMSSPSESDPEMATAFEGIRSAGANALGQFILFGVE